MHTEILPPSLILMLVTVTCTKQTLHCKTCLCPCCCRDDCRSQNV